MKTLSYLSLIACAGLLGSCVTAPKELVDARTAYKQASDGPAAQVAPAELHVANQALAKAEQSFKDDSDSYMTRDLAYVAQRKSQLAGARAEVILAQRNQIQANRDFQASQGQIVENTKKNLNQTREALEASLQHGKTTEGKLSAEQEARNAAQNQAANAQVALQQSELSGAQTAEKLAAEQKARTETENKMADTKAALLASERSGAMTAEKLAAEQDARAAAEKQANEAQAALAKLAAVKSEPRGVVITLSGSVLFASNQSVLLPEAQARLNQVADVLLSTRERNITIEGHTDSRGSESNNVTLSQSRANAVRDYLVQRGYEADRIKAIGLGEGRPVANNGNAEGRANNRRVEIIIDRAMHSSN
jgi:outer membrane protein OmpA-like peptidoglycan-associated protein